MEEGYQGGQDDGQGEEPVGRLSSRYLIVVHFIYFLLFITNIYFNKSISICLIVYIAQSLSFLHFLLFNSVVVFIFFRNNFTQSLGKICMDTGQH